MDIYSHMARFCAGVPKREGLGMVGVARAEAYLMFNGGVRSRGPQAPLVRIVTWSSLRNDKGRQKAGSQAHSKLGGTGFRRCRRCKDGESESELEESFAASLSGRATPYPTRRIYAKRSRSCYGAQNTKTRPTP